MARGWPKASKAPLAPKFSAGDVVQKPSGGIWGSDNVGELIGEFFGLGSKLICYVVKVEQKRYLVQVIPHLDLQPVTGRTFSGRFGWVDAEHLKQTKREKKMTEHKVYDGKTFNADKMKEAGRSATSSKGRGHVER